MATSTPLLDDQAVVQRVFDHIDHRTTDLSEETWREPVVHYRSPDRLEQELTVVLRRYPTPFCPSAALPEPGAYVARVAAGTPLVAVRGDDGVARVFRNACRHRGTQLADGSGCATAFVCSYHGWCYALDGRLSAVPHEYGFPGLDMASLGLVAVDAVERNGLVFVTQDEPSVDEGALDELPALVPPDATLVASHAYEVGANWKIVMDSFLEGYHTRFAHRDTFYPVQYDNVNVIETFGRNNRVTFPFQSIEKLRDVPPAERRVDGRVLTYVYHLFPNVAVITFPEHMRVFVMEPLAVDRCAMVSYTLSTPSPRYERDASAELERAGEFVLAGGAEDTALSLAVQRGLASDANECFEFGRFEGALTHFHRTLQATIEAGTAPR